jgi:predicted nucleotide-binding protein with TIR-like domain
VARTAGTPNRNYPPLKLAEALQVPRAIQDEASGMSVSRLTLAELLDISPASSVFRELVASSRFYGFTTGGINSTEFALTELGKEVTSDDETASIAAMKKGVMRIEPFKTFFHAFSTKKIPVATAFKEFLTKHAAVSEARAEDCMEHIVADAHTAGLTRAMKGGAEYIDLAGVPVTPSEDEGDGAEESVGSDEPTGDLEAMGEVEPGSGQTNGNGAAHQANGNGNGKRSSKIFVGGRKGKSLDQLMKLLAEYQIPAKLAEDEPNRGRPISEKVADTMHECGAGIIVFTPDVELQDKDGNPVWMPSDNVVHELGAASMEYGKRIVIFREERVTLASNYSDIGHIAFKEGELSAKAIELFRELVDFGLIQFTVPE